MRIRVLMHEDIVVFLASRLEERREGGVELATVRYVER